MSILASSETLLAPVQPVIFYAFALLVCISAWSIVLSGNIVRMAVYLLFTLGGAAGMYMLLHAQLLAAVQLIVYAGGTLILIIFGVMLTSKNPFAQLQAKLWEKMVALGLGLLIAGFLLLAWITTPAIEGAAGGPGIAMVNGGGVSGVTGGGVGQDYDMVQAVGRGLLSTYLVPFEITGVLLLVVMIGAAYMARRRDGSRARG